MEKIIHSLEGGDLYPYVSNKKVQLTSKEFEILNSSHQYILNIPRTMQYDLAQAHGILMYFGWWVFGAVGMIIARYGKPLYPGKMIFGQKVWFQFHRNLFVIGLGLQIAGFVVVWVQKGGQWKGFGYYSYDHETYSLKLHTILGIICTGFALMQPFMAWIRPKPKSQNRAIFNWAHWFFGTASWILASKIQNSIS